jgi:hypothetical protein
MGSSAGGADLIALNTSPNLSEFNADPATGGCATCQRPVMSAGDERNGRNRGTTLPFGMILIFGFFTGRGLSERPWKPDFGRNRQFRPVAEGA